MGRARVNNRQGGTGAGYQMQVERHEAKYLVPPGLVAPIREFIAPFCEPDAHGRGDPPEYSITTLQLDNPWLSLHRAKEEEHLNRFKLRVRTYGEPGSAPVFTEVKRKFGQVVNKSRATIPFEQWSEDIVRRPEVNPRLKRASDVENFLEFKRLVQASACIPQVLVRYIRESYRGKFDHYARVTFDRRLEDQPARGWACFGEGGRWRPMDSAMTQGMGYAFSAVVLELKTVTDAPSWMIEVVRQFDLTRSGHCKYSNAVWMDMIGTETDNMHPFAVSMGMAKPTFSAPPSMRALTPITSPFRLTRGPPLLPGLIAASVWIHVL